MLNNDINRYVELHRELGFKFRDSAYLLRHFAAFAEQRGDTFVRTETALEWAVGAPSAAQRRNRLSVVRRFACSMRAEDERYEIPPKRAFGRPVEQRRIPHIFERDEIRRLLVATSQLKPATSLRARTFATLFALLAATGLRISEALALRLDDITAAGLVIQKTKFRKSRLVPLHPTARIGLERYLLFRQHLATTERFVFLSEKGGRIGYSTANKIFLKLMRAIGLRGPAGVPGPCLHDLRHTFSVRALEDCAGSDEEVDRHIVALSTYLGHAHVSETYWYLQATPRLMTGIARTGELLFEENQP